MMDDIEVLRHVMRVENIQLAGRAVGRTAERFAHLRIHIFKITHTVSRMQIEGGFHVAGVNVLQELPVIGE